MKLILYTNQCIKCRWGERLEDLKQFAALHGFDLVGKRTSYDRGLIEKAKQLSNLSQPFIYNESNGRSVRFIDNNWGDLLDV